MSDNTVEKFHRRHAHSILRELVDRISEQCESAGRIDLVEAVYLLEKLAHQNAVGLRQSRAQMLGILKEDDQLKEIGEMLMDYDRQQREAAIERIDATIQ